MSTRQDVLRNFLQNGRIVIVGASLAGLCAAETIRKEGFRGKLIMIGDELREPYDRPPLSKQVLSGWIPAQETELPHIYPLEGVEMRLGVAATGLDPVKKQVQLANGDSVDFDRLLITTGVRARPWPKPEEAGLDGVCLLRTSEDAQRLQQHLAAKPRRVLIVGAGFTGSEVASVCIDRGLAVTVTERSGAPLISALGSEIGGIAAKIQRKHGVDLRCNTTVTRLEGDAQGHVRRAYLSDGAVLDVDVVVMALGSIRNTEWLRSSGLAAGQLGVTCDAGCRAFDINGIVTDDVFVAGDVSRFPHPLYEYELIVLEHWGNAVEQAKVAGHNMVNDSIGRKPYLTIPTFWSVQFGNTIKSVGLPPFGEEVMIVQGSPEKERFVAVYGHKGRTVAAVGFNQGKWLPFYEKQIAAAAPFPPAVPAYDQSTTKLYPVSAGFTKVVEPSATPSIALTGYIPGELRATYLDASPPAPKVAIGHA